MNDATQEMEYAKSIAFKKIKKNFELRIVYSTAYSLALLASDKIESCYSETEHFFDFAVSAIIHQEAGGVITNIDGGTLSLSKGFIAS
jgi:fructose-1,6-bisphosphatase/inositol monophosphatase family enzyme